MVNLKRIQAVMIGLAATILILAACEQTDSESPAVVSGSPDPIEATIEPTELLVVVVTPTAEEGEEGTVEAGETAAPQAEEAGTVEATEEAGTAEATAETGGAEAAEEAGTAEATEEAGTMEADAAEGAAETDTETPQAEETAEAEAIAEAGAEATEQAGTVEATEEAGGAEATEQAAGTAEATDEAATGVETEETDKPSEAETPQAEATEEPAETEAETETPTAQLSDEQLVEMGEGLYMLNCAACHQENGQGIEGAYPPLAGNEFILTEDPSPAIQVVYTGRAGMPRFQDYVSNEEIAAILSYVRNAWENNASTVSIEQVQEIPETLLSEVEAVEE